MFGRVNQLVRHLSRPLPNYAHRSAAASPSQHNPSWRFPTMTSSPAQPPSTAKALKNSERTIHTAACLIIGDEVLGGKVCAATRSALSSPFPRGRNNVEEADNGHCESFGRCRDTKRQSIPIPRTLPNIAFRWACSLSASRSLPTMRARS